MAFRFDFTIEESQYRPEEVMVQAGKWNIRVLRVNHASGLVRIFAQARTLGHAYDFLLDKDVQALIYGYAHEVKKEATA